MKLHINGVDYEVESPLLTPLLHVLREELGIRNPKAGCQQGGCGACTVLVDGEPRRSCLLPVAAINGAGITTLEGLGVPERLAPVQQAFVHATIAVRLLHSRDAVGRTHIERGAGDDEKSIASPWPAMSAAVQGT